MPMPMPFSCFNLILIWSIAMRIANFLNLFHFNCGLLRSFCFKRRQLLLTRLALLHSELWHKTCLSPAIQVKRLFWTLLWCIASITKIICSFPVGRFRVFIPCWFMIHLICWFTSLSSLPTSSTHYLWRSYLDTCRECRVLFYHQYSVLLWGRELSRTSMPSMLDQQEMIIFGCHISVAAQ